MRMYIDDKNLEYQKLITSAQQKYKNRMFLVSYEDVKKAFDINPLNVQIIIIISQWQEQM